jgi:hypothetical protein
MKCRKVFLQSSGRPRISMTIRPRDWRMPPASLTTADLQTHFQHAGHS